MTEANEAVNVTRRAYEAGATAWAGRGLDRSYIQSTLDRFARLVRAIRGGVVLDLGCGPGFDSRDLSARGLRVVGFDVTRAMLSLSLDRPDASRGLVQGDSRRLPFAAASFDGVWASASLLHLPKAQIADAAAEVARVLRASGIFYSAMKEGDADGFDSPGPNAPVSSTRYFAHYRAPEWTAILEGAGFRVLEQEIDADRRPGFPDWIVTLATRR